MWVKRTPWSVLLIAVLLLGALDWHPAGESLATTATVRPEIYFPGAEHPDQPAHFEHAEAAHRSSCPVCINRMQTSGAHLLSSAGVAPPLPRVREAVELSSQPASVPLPPSGGRAPPFVS